MSKKEGSGDFASRKEEAKFGVLRSVGLVREGVFGNPGDKTTIRVTDREITARVEHRQFDGVMHTAFIPSNREIANLRRSIVMG